MLQIDAGISTERREADLDLGRLRPPTFPGEDDALRRFAGKHPANLELFTVGVALIQSPAGERLEAEILQPPASE